MSDDDGNGNQNSLPPELGKFAISVFGDLVCDAVGLLGDRVRYWRYDNLVSVHEKYQRKWRDKGLDVCVSIPAGVSIRLLEEAGLTEDDSLQELWANLLVNGMDPDFNEPIERSYVSILSELTPFDAVVFDHIASLPRENFDTRFKVQDMQDIPFDPLSPETEVSICNIHRLGLLRSRSDTAVSSASGDMLAPRLTGYRGAEYLILSALGECFHKAIS